MDNKKAITILQSVRANTVNALIAKVAIREALDMAIAALEQQGEDNEWCLDCKEYDKEQHCCHRFTKVIRRAVEDHRMERQEQQRWIPEEERLPEKDGNYLVTLYDSTERWTEVLCWNSTFGGRWQGLIEDDLSDIGNVSAWRPLPEPYQEDKA